MTGGIGDLAKWMTANARVYEAAAGTHLYPGSLNVELEQPWHVPPGAKRLKPEDFDVGGVSMNIVPCTVEGVPAFILRTDRNNAGTGNHPPTIIELAASVRLRDHLRLVDGDEVLITLP